MWREPPEGKAQILIEREKRPTIHSEVKLESMLLQYYLCGLLSSFVFPRILQGEMPQRETTMIPMRERGYGLKSSAESLVNHLMRKLQNPKQEYPLIPELDIYRLEPEDLISKYYDMNGITSGDEEGYFFYPLCGHDGEVISRLTQEGFWRSTGNERKAEETNQTKWAQRNLVYFRGSQQKKIPSDWAMQEYMIESDRRFCLCHIHKKRRNKGSNKATQPKKRQKKGNNKAESAVPEHKSPSPASVAPVRSENQEKPEKITPEKSVDMVMEPQTRSSSSDMNVSAHNTSSLMQQQLLAQEGLLHSADALKDSTESGVFSEPQFPQMYMGDQSRHFDNASFDICSQQHSSWPYQNNGSPNFHSSLLGQYPQHVLAQSFSNESPNFRSPQYHHPDVFAQSFTNGSPDFQFRHYHLPDVFAQLCNYEMPDLLFLCFQYLQDVYARWLNDESLRPILDGFFHLFCFIFLKFQHPPQYQNPQDVSFWLSNRTPSNIPSPPHYQLLMPMDEIFPSVDNGFPNCIDTTSQVGSYGHARAEMPSFSINHGTQEISSQASTSTTMDLQNLPVSSNINVPEHSMSPPQHNQITTEGRCPPAHDTYYNSLHLEDLLDPLDPQILMREQSPCSENAFFDGCDQEYANWLHPQGVTPEEGGNEVILPETPTNQSSNDVLLGFRSPPQQPQMMPTEEICPTVNNTSFNGRDSGNTYYQLDAHGQGAPVPVLSMNYGHQVTNFKEASHSTLHKQTQTTTSPPTSDLLSPEQLQMLQELLSAYNMQPSSDRSEGGSLYAHNFGQSLQTNLGVTQDFATDSLTASQDSDINSLLDSFFAASPPPEVVMGENSVCEHGTVTGGYSTNYCGVPYTSGGTCEMETSNQ